MKIEAFQIASETYASSCNIPYVDYWFMGVDNLNPSGWNMVGYPNGSPWFRATNKMRQSARHSHFYLPGSIPPSEEVLSWPSHLSLMNSGLCCNP